MSADATVHRDPDRSGRIVRPSGRRIQLRYFEDILPVEFEAIVSRRQAIGRSLDNPARGWITPLRPAEPSALRGRADVLPDMRHSSRRPSPDPAQLPFGPRGPAAAAGGGPPRRPGGADPENPNYDRTRPEPVPCTVNGLALSGGGIRSAAVCLGALQALNQHGRIDSVDYLSTVSGGGYTGACLSAAMSKSGGLGFPFGADVFDSRAVAHLRNYSNYLLPRGRSMVRNVAEAAAVLARGLLANIVLVVATLLGCALLTYLAYPNEDALTAGSFLPQLVDGIIRDGGALNGAVGAWAFALTLWLVAALVLVLLVWAVLRSFPQFDPWSDDTDSPILTVARLLVVCTAAIAFLDLQPVAIKFLMHLPEKIEGANLLSTASLKTIGEVLTAFGTVTSVLSSWLGHFLKTSERTTSRTTIALRVVTFAALLIASLVLPLALWLLYLFLSAWNIGLQPLPGAITSLQQAFGEAKLPIWQIYLGAFAVLTFVSVLLCANGYSLHDALKLSALHGAMGPYHIINSAMNVQGSAEANRRGRNADFFMLTRDFVGSDLTLYAPTKETLAATTEMEEIDSRLNLGTAMAISGAAVSANMGASTVRLLSPTLALLNIRLGYWLRNPRDLARSPNVQDQLHNAIAWFVDKFYLLVEMLNLLDEKSRNVYLTDGGHIENLGIYELLKRGCESIIVIDAEADPAMAFGSLLTLERYARIDLGVRIALPWEQIARMTQATAKNIAAGWNVPSKGPHCAVGRILYQSGAQGILIYFKSSLSGDEKDYILDYKKRYADFPHESTGDQFFSEEQFEVYRALGYHMIDGFFSRADAFAWLASGEGAFASADDAFAQVVSALPAIA